jgi:mRNA-degrading endonuclease RelE of RelBE toxin-antitoxin system
LKYAVFLSRQAEKFYKKLDANTQSQLKESFVLLESQPRFGKLLHGDLKSDFSLRAGKIRIVYRVLEKEKTVYVIAIGQRSTIYQ